MLLWAIVTRGGAEVTMGRWQTRIQFGTYRGPSGPRYVPNWIRDLPSPIDCMYTKSLSAIYDLDFCSALLAHFLRFCPFDRCRHQGSRKHSSTWAPLGVRSYTRETVWGKNSILGGRLPTRSQLGNHRDFYYFQGVFIKIFIEWKSRKTPRRQPRGFSWPPRDEYRSKLNELKNNERKG